MSDTEIQDEAINVDTEKGNFSYPEDYAYDAGVGLSEDTIHSVSYTHLTLPTIRLV